MVDSEQLKRGEELVLAAFSDARRSGRENWREMTTPVLKNRILSLTSRRFNERDWGASTFQSFLSLYPNLVRVDNTTRPPTAILIRDVADDTSGVTIPLPGGERITPDQRVRPDLWRSVLDYSSGNKYVWTGEAAVPSNGGEPLPADGLLLPTVSRGDYDKWREQFSEQSLGSLSPSDAEAVERWRTESLGTRYLPPALRGAWNAQLKRHVIDHLQRWFADQKLETPRDLVTRPEPSTGLHTDTEQLRAFVQDCVATMTRAELETLALPPSAAMRLLRRARRG